MSLRPILTARRYCRKLKSHLLRSPKVARIPTIRRQWKRRKNNLLAGKKSMMKVPNSSQASAPRVSKLSPKVRRKKSTSEVTSVFTSRLSNGKPNTSSKRRLRRGREGQGQQQLGHLPGATNLLRKIETT